GQQELVVGRLLNLDEVRHLCDFLDVSEELANAFATGECLLRHRGLSFRRPSGANLPKRDWHRPRVKFRPFRRPGSSFQEENPESRHQTLKTQKDARGASTHPPVRTIVSRTAKARNCLSPNGLPRNAAVPPAHRAFVLAAPYVM